MKQLPELEKFFGENYSYNNFLSEDEAKKDLTHYSFKEHKGLKAGGIPFYSNGDTAYINTSEDHTLIIGTTGSMKTRALIIPEIYSLAHAGENMVILDPKGDISDKTSKYLQKEGYDVKIINLRDTDNSDCFNPLYEPYHLIHDSKTKDTISRSKATELISDLAESIKNAAIKDSLEVDTFWKNNAKELLEGIMILLIYLSDDIQESVISNIFTFLIDGFNEYDDEFGNKQPCKLDEMLKGLRDDFSPKQKIFGALKAAPQTRNCLLSEAKTLLTPFFTTKTIQWILSNHTINFRDFANKDKKMALFICVPDEKSTYDVLVTIIISQMYAILCDEASKQPNQRLPKRVNFILDEFSNIPAIPKMDKIISASRSRNIRLTLVIQSNNQLKAQYPKDAQTIKENCSTWIFLNTRDKTLRDDVIELIGEDLSKPNDRYLKASDFAYINKHFPYVDALIINRNNKPFLTTMADYSLYEEAKHNGLIKLNINKKFPHPISLDAFTAYIHSINHRDNEYKLYRYDNIPDFVNNSLAMLHRFEMEEFHKRMEQPRKEQPVEIREQQEGEEVYEEDCSSNE